MNIGPVFGGDTASEAHAKGAEWIRRTGRRPEHYEIRTYPQPGIGGYGAVVHVNGTQN